MNFIKNIIHILYGDLFAEIYEALNSNKTENHEMTPGEIKEYIIKQKGGLNNIIEKDIKSEIDQNIRILINDNILQEELKKIQVKDLNEYDKNDIRGSQKTKLTKEDNKVDVNKISLRESFVKNELQKKYEQFKNKINENLKKKNDFPYKCIVCKKNYSEHQYSLKKECCNRPLFKECGEDTSIYEIQNQNIFNYLDNLFKNYNDSISGSLFDNKSSVKAYLINRYNRNLANYSRKSEIFINDRTEEKIKMIQANDDNRDFFNLMDNFMGLKKSMMKNN